MRFSILNLLFIFVSLTPFATASTQTYNWIYVPFQESHCARLNADGTEAEKVDNSKCSQEGLSLSWHYMVTGFECSLISPINSYFFILVDNSRCGIPANAYYKRQRKGLGPKDFECVMKTRDSEFFYVRVADTFCSLD